MLKDVLPVETEYRRKSGRLLSRLIAQHGIHRGGIDDLARVENVAGVPGLFDLAHQPVVAFTDHLRNEFAAQSPVAVFAAERATISFYQRGNFDRDRAEHCVA